LGEHIGWFAQSSFDRIWFGFYNIADNYTIAVDAVDYSWSQEYYTNRNQDPLASSLTYAIFINNTRLTTWNPWSIAAHPTYEITAQQLGVGTHNISLRYNDRQGNWYHRDVFVKVKGTIVTDWDVDPNVYIEIDLLNTRESTFMIEFHNIGNGTLLDLNFTIKNLPAEWNISPRFQVFPQLSPSAIIWVVFKITIPPNENNFIKHFSISFTASIKETGEKIEGVVNGAIWSRNYKNFMIWLIIILGSVSTLTLAGYYIYRRKEQTPASPKWSKNKQATYLLKQRIAEEFPGSYSVISPSLIHRINQITGLTEIERYKLIQDTIQLDTDEEIEKWISDFEYSLGER